LARLEERRLETALMMVITVGGTTLMVGVKGTVVRGTSYAAAFGRGDRAS
jgi:hypothetical protein